MADLDTRIEAHALQNAVRYGQALTGKVIPKILGEFPDEKKDMAALKTRIDAIVARVNALPDAERPSRLESIAPDLLERKEKRKELPELKHAIPGKVVTRIPPEPSKYNHLGHALTFLLNRIYADRYQGKCVLRFEDANPEKCTQEFVDAMREDIQEYLGITPDATRFVSDDMDVLYAHAETLIRKSGAYLCNCDRETMGRLREEGVECPCRARTGEGALADWRAFVAGEREGWVLRFMGEMQSKNTVLRDPVLFRIVKTPHFTKGTRYKAWPLYDFYSPIEEHLSGVTHVLRSNEFDLRVELQQRIQRLLDLPEPEVLHYGRFNVKDATTKGREIRELIESGEYLGWDDPRLVTLKALKRRGIRREAYVALVNDLGLSPYQVNLDFSMLAAKNRDIVDPTANRYAFVWDPVEIAVEGADGGEARMHLHPARKDGTRVLRVDGTYLIRQDDAETLADGEFRLKDHLTVEKRGDAYISRGHGMPGRKGFPNLSWLPAHENIPVTVMMPDATVREGFTEAGIRDVKVDDVIQFERFGFCRLDSIEDGTYRFWYAHD